MIENPQVSQAYYYVESGSIEFTYITIVTVVAIHGCITIDFDEKPCLPQRKVMADDLFATRKEAYRYALEVFDEFIQDDKNYKKRFIRDERSR